MSPKPIPETISYTLAHCAKLHRSYASTVLGEIGLHVGQEFLLQILWQEDRLTQSELASRMYVQLATINRMIERMAKAGYVQKVADPEDGRVSRVQLTDKGRELKTPTEEAWNKLEERTTAGFTEDELEDLQNMLSRVLANLCDEA